MRRTGYRTVGLRLIAVTAGSPGYSLMADAAMVRRRLADRLGAMCGTCGRQDMRAMLESFPGTEVPSLAAAASVMSAAGRPDCGILVDTLHYARSHSSPDRFDVMGGHYPAGGINLGPAMTLGFVAGLQAAGATTPAKVWPIARVGT